MSSLRSQSQIGKLIAHPSGIIDLTPAAFSTQRKISRSPQNDNQKLSDPLPSSRRK
jgi:hypothetical protein